MSKQKFKVKRERSEIDRFAYMACLYSIDPLTKEETFVRSLDLHSQLKYAEAKKTLLLHI